MNNIAHIKQTILFVLLYSFTISSCQNNYSADSDISLTVTDTIILPSSNCKMPISYYDAKTNSNLIYYFDYSNNYLVKISNKNIVREINFNKLFNKPGHYRLVRHFFYLNNNDIYLLAKPITPKWSSENKVEIKRDYCLFRIDSANKITDTIQITNNTNKNFYIQSPLIQLPIISNEDSVVYTCAVAVTSQPGEIPYNDYQINNNSRLKMFSQDCSILIVIKNNKAYFKSKNISYPKIFLDTSISFYYYFPSIVSNSNQEILTLYSDLDTLYSFNISSESYSKHPFSSKYNIPFIPFNKNNLFDYEYISRYSTESYSNLYLKQNRKSKQIYIIIIKPVKYVNNDGTINKAKDNPFSVIVLDSNYSELGEFDIPTDYIKHDCFVYGNGIAFLNSKLSEQDSNNFLHYVIFETKNQ